MIDLAFESSCSELQAYPEARLRIQIPPFPTQERYGAGSANA